MTRSIGLDIGHLAVRAVVCDHGKGGWRILGHAAAERLDANGEQRPLAAVFSELDSRVGLTRGSLSVADSARNLLIRYLPTVPLPPDRMVKLLRLELAQHAGEAGELAADVYPVPLAGDEVIHAAVMAQPEQIRELISDLKRAGVVPQRIQVGAAALANATLVAPVVSGEDLALVVDVGAHSTRVALVGDGGRLLAFRQLALGGAAFTQAIAEGRGIDHAKAEHLKLHWNIGHALSGGAESKGSVTPAIHPEKAQTVFAEPEERRTSGTDDEPLVLQDDEASDRIHIGDDDVDPIAPTVAEEPGIPFVATPGRRAAMLDFDDEPEKAGHQTMELGGATLGPEMTRIAEQLYTQLASTVTWFKAQLQTGRVSPTKVVLCGGGSSLVGLDVYLARRFRIPVERFDPCADLLGERPAGGHAYALALGLALSDDLAAVRMDLLPEGDVKGRLWRQRLAWPYVGAVAVLLAALIFGTTLVQAQWRHEESLVALSTYRDQHDRLNGELATLESEREALSDDLRAIASRIYLNRDLLYVIRVLKERAPENKELWITRLETIPPELEKPIPGKRAGLGTGAAKPGKDSVETTLDRGAIEVEGRVKFDDKGAQDPETLNSYFNTYMKALDVAVAGSSNVALFDPNQTRVFIHWQHEEPTGTSGTAPAVRPGKRPIAADGSYPFGVRFVLRPTELGQATEAVETP